MNINIDNHKNIEEKLINLINTILPEPVEINILLSDIDLEKVGLNSIGMVKLIIGIEDTFNIVIDEAYLMEKTFNSYSKIESYVLNMLSNITD